MQQPPRSVPPVRGVSALRPSTRSVSTASSTETHHCARCRYTFEAMTPPECPMCGTRDVEALVDPTDRDDEPEDDVAE